jgi:ABC-type glutathione transport system ATPase component
MTQTPAPVLASVEKLVKNYPMNSSSTHRKVVAVNGVSFSIRRGHTLGLVGESGAGKSTIARCLACLERPSAGSVWLEGTNLSALSARDLRCVRPQIQLVFQDPMCSMNPKMTVMEILKEPFLIQRRFGKQHILDVALGLLDRVALPHDVSGRWPTELSGGERQRLAIARALALEPKLLILDEALSALDCSTQGQIANLLLDLQHAFGLAYLFITHDLAMATRLCGEIAVLEYGRIVESDRTETVMFHPKAPTTRKLLADARSTMVSRVCP